MQHLKFMGKLDHFMKSDLSERDICIKFITPAITKAGWDIQKQIREEVTFTDGRIYDRGHLRRIEKIICMSD